MVIHSNVGNHSNQFDKNNMVIRKGVIEMFEVYEKLSGDCYRVFGVRHVGDHPTFLIYKKGQWLWESCHHYEPK
jgi:hypothetical protein